MAAAAIRFQFPFPHPVRDERTNRLALLRSQDAGHDRTFPAHSTTVNMAAAATAAGSGRIRRLPLSPFQNNVTAPR